MPPVFLSGFRLPAYRTATLFLLLLSLFGIMALPATALEAGTTAVVDKRARLRAGAGPNHPVLGTLPAGQRLEIIGSEGDFYQVHHHGKNGWVAKELLKVNTTAVAANNIPAVTTTTAPPPPTEAPAAEATRRIASTEAATVPDKLPAPPPTIVVDTPTPVSTDSDGLFWPWLLLALAGGALGGFAAGYHWRESYYRKRLYGLRL